MLASLPTPLLRETLHTTVWPSLERCSLKEKWGFHFYLCACHPLGLEMHGSLGPEFTFELEERGRAPNLPALVCSPHPLQAPLPWGDSVYRAEPRVSAPCEPSSLPVFCGCSVRSMHGQMLLSDFSAQGSSPGT